MFTTKSLTIGKTNVANQYIERLISLAKGTYSEAVIAAILASIYSKAGIQDKAEEYFRQALAIEPTNPNRINDLAYFLIDKDRNINEGFELADNALELSPDNYNFMHTKGWGLYKKSKNMEALELLEKSWGLRLRSDHELYFHLEAAKKAVTNQKNN